MKQQVTTVSIRAQAYRRLELLVKRPKVKSRGRHCGSLVHHRVLVGVRQVPQAHQTDPQNHLILPECFRCGTPMSLALTEDEYPGYQRSVFECPNCGVTMTRWAGVAEIVRELKVHS